MICPGPRIFKKWRSEKLRRKTHKIKERAPQTSSPQTTLFRQKGCSPSQLTLAWLLGHGEDVVAIPGTRYPHRLDENIGAMDVELSAAEIEQISSAVPKGSASGTRYPAGGMSAVYL